MLSVRAIKGAGLLVLSRLSGRLIDLVLLLILARILTPADFGLVAIATMFVAVADMLLEVPVTQALVRLETIDKTHLDTGFTLGLARGCAVAILALAAAWPISVAYGDPTLRIIVPVLALGPFFRGLLSPGMVRFARELGYGPLFVVEITGKIAAFVLAITVVLLGGSYWALVSGYVASSCAASAMSYLLAPYRPALSLKRWDELKSFMGWFTLSQFVAALNWQIDRMMIGAIGDRAEVGRYVVAGDVAVLPSQSMIGPALAPIMAAFSRIVDQPARFRTGFLKASRLVMLVATPIFIGMSLTSDLVVSLLLGEKWHEAAPLLQMLSLSMISVPYLQVLSCASLATGRTDIVFKLNVIDLCLRTVLVMVGLAMFSAIGAAAARVPLTVALLAVYLFFVRGLIGISILDQLRNMAKIAVAAAVMAVAVIVLRRELAVFPMSTITAVGVVGTFGAAVYVGTLLALGVRVVAAPSRLELADRW